MTDAPVVACRETAQGCPAGHGPLDAGEGPWTVVSRSKTRGRNNKTREDNAINEDKNERRRMNRMNRSKINKTSNQTIIPVVPAKESVATSPDAVKQWRLIDKSTTYAAAANPFVDTVDGIKATSSAASDVTTPRGDPDAEIDDGTGHICCLAEVTENGIVSRETAAFEAELADERHQTKLAEMGRKEKDPLDSKSNSSLHGSNACAFEVHRTAADGNCVFNAIVQSRSLNSGNGRPLGDAEEKSQARALRDKVVAQLLVRRDDVEPFLPMPFDEYVEVMSREGTWGGEPELCMASIVLEAVISVHAASDMSLVAEFDVAEVKGSQSSVSIPVLYHQDLHYEALRNVNESDQCLKDEMDVAKRTMKTQKFGLKILSAELDQTKQELSQTKQELSQTKQELNRVIWERDELDAQLDEVTRCLRAKVAELDEYRWDAEEYETDEYETGECETEEWKVDESEEDELAAADDIDNSETPLAGEAHAAHLYSDDSSASSIDTEETDAMSASPALGTGRLRLAIMPGNQLSHQPGSSTWTSAYKCDVEEVILNGMTTENLDRAEPERTLSRLMQQLLVSRLYDLCEVGVYSPDGVTTQAVPMIKTPWGKGTFQIVSFDHQTLKIGGCVWLSNSDGFQFEVQFEVCCLDEGPVLLWPPVTSQ